MVPTLHLDPIQLCVVIALAAQLPIAGLALLTVFSQRKKLPSIIVPGESDRAVDEVAQPAPLEAAPPAEVSALSTAPEPIAIPPAAAETAPPEPDTAPLNLAETTPLPTLAPVAVVVEPPAADAPAPIIEAPLTPAPVIEVEAPLAPEEARRAPVRIGLGLRKTRENFLARIRAAITGSAKADEIYEGLEEALIGADVGVEGSLKLVEAVRARLKNDSRPEVIRDALKEEIERVLIAAERPVADSGDAPLVI